MLRCEERKREKVNGKQQTGSLFCGCGHFLVSLLGRYDGGLTQTIGNREIGNAQYGQVLSKMDQFTMKQFEP